MVTETKRGKATTDCCYFVVAARHKKSAEPSAVCGLFVLSDADYMIVRAEAFECSSVEFFAVVRMGDADKQLGTFLH